MHHNYIEIFLILSFVIIIAKLAGVLSQRFGQPAVLGEILAGLILGPTILSLAYWPIFPESAHEYQDNIILKSAVESLKGEGDESTDKLGDVSSETEEAIRNLQTLSDLPDEKKQSIAKDVTSHIDEYRNDRRTFLEEIIKVLADLGVLFLMFLAGLETDLKMMKKVGKVATYAAAGGVILPMGFGLLVTMLLIPHTGFYTALFAGTILCATSVSISAQTLKELGRLKSKEGTTILGAAVIDDVMGIIILSLVIAFNPIKIGGGPAFEKLYETYYRGLSQFLNFDEPSSKMLGIIVLVFSIIIFFVVFFRFGMSYFQKILDYINKLPTSQGVFAFALAITLFYGWGAEYIGAVAAITGTYLCGVLLAQTTYHHEIEEKLSVITYAFFVPIFFINIGMEANARSIFSNPELAWYTVAIAFVAIIAKIVGCLVGAKMGGFNMVESIRVGMGMVSRGEVGLIVASVGLSAGIIGRDIFSSMIIMVLATTLVTPILLKFAFKGEKTPGSAG